MAALSRTAPVERYRDPATFERERALIFARSWQFLGLEADLVRTGDYLAEVIAGYPIVVVRDGKGALHGFHNLCRHRAGPLVGDDKGRCDRAFVCRFHAWRYSFDGDLIEAPGFERAPGFDPTAYPLIPVKVETWRGLIFINIDLAAEPLAKLLGPLDARLGQQPRRTAHVTDRHSVKSNWKVYVENYLDGYHQEGVHPALADEAGAQRLNVEMVGEVAIYVATTRAGSVESLWAWAWPSFGFSVYQRVMLLEAIRPLGPDSTQIDHIFLYEAEDPSVELAMLNAERITEEDAWMSERVQQNLDAGIYTQGVLSPDQEGAVAWFQARIAQALAV